jgi:dephospho-CoA kinase
MKNIAITGSFASGKSFVLSCAKELGYKVFSCDDFIRDAYKDINLQNLVISQIKGLEIFDKKKLSKIIYDNPEAKKKLEFIIHPLVRLGIKSFEEENKNQKIIFTEVPLLFESNFDKHFVCSVCVYCSEETRLQRAKKRGIDDISLYNKIKSAQLPQEEKKRRADFTINSDNSQKEIEKSLKDIIRGIK